MVIGRAIAVVVVVVDIDVVGVDIGVIIGSMMRLLVQLVVTSRESVAIGSGQTAQEGLRLRVQSVRMVAIVIVIVVVMVVVVIVRRDDDGGLGGQQTFQRDVGLHGLARWWEHGRWIRRRRH